VAVRGDGSVLRRIGRLPAGAGADGTLAGTEWRANCFKCADETSHPHWASWAPIGEALNFHQPQYFGVFHFAQP